MKAKDTYVQIRDLKLMYVGYQAVLPTNIREVTPVVATTSSLIARLTTVRVPAGHFLQVVRPRLDVLGGERAAVVAAGSVVENAVVVDGDSAVVLVAEDGVVLGVAESDLGADLEEAVCYGFLGLDVLIGLVDSFAGTEGTGLCDELVRCVVRQELG